MPEYHTVFTALQKSPPWWLPLVFPGFVLVFTIGFTAAYAKTRYWVRRAYIVIVYLVTVFLAWMVNPAAAKYMYAEAKRVYLKGDYQVVQGTISNFRPMPYSGHQDESFSVNDIQFSYSDFIESPCFNNSTSHGGPIREGLRVRISYSGDCILKLEVAQ